VCWCHRSLTGCLDPPSWYSPGNQGLEAGTSPAGRMGLGIHPIGHTPLLQSLSWSPGGWASAASGASVIMGLEGGLPQAGPLPLKAAEKS
jgi:hypothetical protein